MYPQRLKWFVIVGVPSPHHFRLPGGTVVEVDGILQIAGYGTPCRGERMVLLLS